MAFSIKNPEADRLARELAAATGENITEAVTQALRERLIRRRAPQAANPIAARLDEIARRCAAMPDRTTETDDEILGYDENGLPT